MPPDSNKTLLMCQRRVAGNVLNNVPGFIAKDGNTFFAGMSLCHHGPLRERTSCQIL